MKPKDLIEILLHDWSKRTRIKIIPKSRHTTIIGFTGDCEKYNQAQILGWKVLRYTAKNFSQVTKDLDLLISGI